MDKWYNLEISSKVVFQIKIIPKRTPGTSNFARKFAKELKKK